MKLDAGKTLVTPAERMQTQKENMELFITKASKNNIANITMFSIGPNMEEASYEACIRKRRDSLRIV